jgi:hypothetical protein
VTETPEASPTTTETPDFDVVVTGHIDSQDLLQVIEDILNQIRDPNQLFDFSRFWKTGGSN